MMVHFEDQKLMRLVSDERRLLKTFGLKRSERIKVRIAQLRSVDCMSDLALVGRSGSPVPLADSARRAGAPTS